MSITIELSQETEFGLHTAAARHGQDAAAYLCAMVAEIVREDRLRPNVEVPPTLDKMLVGLTGVIHSRHGQGGSRLSERSGAEMALITQL